MSVDADSTHALDMAIDSIFDSLSNQQVQVADLSSTVQSWRETILTHVALRLSSRIAGKLTEVLSQHLRASPPATVDEQLTIESTIEGLASQFGLATTEPSTGAPAVLFVERLSGNPDELGTYTYFWRHGQSGHGASLPQRELPGVQFQPVNTDFTTWAGRFRRTSHRSHPASTR